MPLRCFAFPPKFLQFLPLSAHTTSWSSLDWSNFCVSCLSIIYGPKHWSLLSALPALAPSKTPATTKNSSSLPPLCTDAPLSLAFLLICCCCFMSNHIPFPKRSVFSFFTSFLNSHFFCLPAGCTLLWFFSPFLLVTI